jgi:hypothetical protein
MFEAKLSEGAVLKKIVESIKDIVTDVNIDISPSGKSTLKLILCDTMCPMHSYPNATQQVSLNWRNQVSN